MPTPISGRMSITHGSTIQSCTSSSRYNPTQSTHHPHHAPKGAFYEAFAPDRGRAYIKRLNFCYTPKHGSGLNVAECELSCLTSQCLSDRRIGELPELQTDIAAWSDTTKAKQRGVDWQFRIENACVKLKRLYPKIKA